MEATGGRAGVEITCSTAGFASVGQPVLGAHPHKHTKILKHTIVYLENFMRKLHRAIMHFKAIACFCLVKSLTC